MRLVSRALAKDVASRYQTAEGMAVDASTALATLTSPAVDAAPRSVRIRASVLVSAAAFLMALAATGAWLGVRFMHRRWARNDAIPAARALANADQPLAGFLLLQKSRTLFAWRHRACSVRQYEPPRTRRSNRRRPERPSRFRITSLRTAHGIHWARHQSRKSGCPGDTLRWRLTQPGHDAVITAPILAAQMNFALDSAAKASPGMVRVGARGYRDYIAFIGWVGPYQTPAYDIDRYEVTNKDYQQFVDSGGYRNRQYWQDKFVDAGRQLSWDEASVRFRDRTGRPGPSTLGRRSLPWTVKPNILYQA